MASLEELRKIRLSKLQIIKKMGIDPYPSKVNRTHEINEIVESFEDIFKKDENIRIVGRIISLRGQGRIFFVDLDDGTGRFQAVLKTDDKPKYANNDSIDGIKFFSEVVDIGDFIEVGGNLFVTKSGQNSIEVKDWRILTKSLLPIPDEHYGLKDEEERHRKRYLDILMNEEQKDLFIKKAKFWNVIRNFFEERDFLSVQTPTLEITTGGAEAEPFITHHNDFDIDVYLRISVGELWQKRLMAAGFPKTYEIGRIYRNEGSSPNHLQEFTNVEFYWAYANYRDGMNLVKELYQKIAKEVFGTTKFETRGHSFDLSGEWKEINYVDEIKRQTGINIFETDEKEIKSFLEKKNVISEAKTFERLVDSLWKFCRKSISGPVFVVGHPDFMQPLAKRDKDNEKLVEEFLVIIGGAEIGKGYSELNNPEDQKERFEHQKSLIETGDKEAMMADDDFIEMLEHGMPPTCGFGTGDRLFAFLADKPVRETQIFPLMKPKD
jgi:lysyl-tRNA synthetase, class II